MTKRTRPYRDELLAALADPVEAEHYINAALQDSPQMFLKALRNVAQARQRMSQVAREAKVARESLYRALSGEGNPTLGTLRAVLSALGFDFQVALKKNHCETNRQRPGTRLAANANTPRRRSVGVRGAREPHRNRGSAKSA